MSEKERALATNQFQWSRLGTIDATAAGADVALAKTERFYSTASVLDNSVAFETDSELNGIEVRFLLSTNNEDVDIDIWAARAEDDNLRRACTLDVVAGDQDSDDSKKFADTINVSNIAGWPKKPKSKVSGTDHIATLHFDFCGYKRIVFHGYGTFDEDCIIEISGY